MSDANGRGKWNIGLWVVQVVLAAIYAMAGFMKVSQPIDALVASGMSYAGDYPQLLTRFIGAAELLGAVGIILPALTRIVPVLTPLAALGFSLIQLLAMLVHGTRGEFVVLPVNVVLLALSLFVFWGRLKKVPISPR